MSAFPTFKGFFFIKTLGFSILEAEVFLTTCIFDE